MFSYDIRLCTFKASDLWPLALLVVIALRDHPHQDIILYLIVLLASVVPSVCFSFFLCRVRVCSEVCVCLDLFVAESQL
jgi:hypothetical protein